MALHQTSGRWRLGLALALLTTGLWATLPVALKITLEQLDPYTLTWFRFTVAAGAMLAWLGLRGRLGAFRALPGRHWALLALAAAALIGNYVLYLLGMRATSPGNAQLLIQLAPLLLALGGVAVFREPFTRAQGLGFGVIVAGLGLFFADQLGAAARAGGSYVRGSALVALGAVAWAAYALAQKQLLVRLTSPLILVFIYAVASVALFPLATPSRLLGLDALHGALLAFCTLNTLAAYGAFAEALEHWEASRVSAVFAVTPLLAIGVVTLVHALWPRAIAPEHIGLAGGLGALAVVAGAVGGSLFGTRRA